MTDQEISAAVESNSAWKWQELATLAEIGDHLALNGNSGSVVICTDWETTPPDPLVSILQKSLSGQDYYLFDTRESASENSGSADSIRETCQNLLDKRLLHVIDGPIGETAARTSTMSIAYLVVQTQSLSVLETCLATLYPRVSHGGTVMILGTPKSPASDECISSIFEGKISGYKRPLVWPVGKSGQAWQKADTTSDFEIERYDYIPEGMNPPDLLPHFPFAAQENPWGVQWEFLRPQVPHIWRSDTRDTTPYKTGNASVEEATCLYEVSRQFVGKRGLEIGTHFGWTGAHLIKAGLEMDFIDPEFNDPDRQVAVDEVFEKVSDKEPYRAWAGYSPQILPEVRQAGDGSKWSFVFIDGNHDGDCPANDAKGVLEHLADDCIVMFHDLTSPFVEAGLNVMREAGFETRLFNTMQILGVAWRGDVVIPEHKPDPNVSRIFLQHLEKYSHPHSQA